MKITQVSAQVVDVGQGFSWGNRRDMKVFGVFVSIETDSGHVGHALAGTSDLPAASVVSAIEHAVTPHLLGGDPFGRPQTMVLSSPPKARGWDLRWTIRHWRLRWCGKRS